MDYTKIQKLAIAMIHYDCGDPRRIQHTTKVHAYAALIGSGEGLDAETQFILESACLVHDIGIRESEMKYGHQNGKMQEENGPAVARKLLTTLGGYSEQQIERICWLIAHHHTYHVCEDIDYQILIEADFLVNLFEDSAMMKMKTDYKGIEKDHDLKRAALAVRKNIFRTKTGLRILNEMFGLEEE